MMLLSVFLLAVSAQANMEWMDFCHPDVIALSQASKDFRADRFDRSTCAEPVFRRGVCEVRVVEGGVAEEARFLVRLRNNLGVFRRYEISMTRNDSDDRARGICLVQGIRLSDGPQREPGR